MEFKVRTHKEIDNGFEIRKVNGETPIPLRGYYSSKIKAEKAIENYILNVIAKQKKLEEQVKKEKEAAKEKAPAKKATTKKAATKKTTKK